MQTDYQFQTFTTWPLLFMGCAFQCCESLKVQQCKGEVGKGTTRQKDCLRSPSGHRFLFQLKEIILFNYSAARQITIATLPANVPNDEKARGREADEECTATPGKDGQPPADGQWAHFSKGWARVESGLASSGISGAPLHGGWAEKFRGSSKVLAVANQIPVNWFKLIKTHSLVQ